MDRRTFVGVFGTLASFVTGAASAANAITINTVRSRYSLWPITKRGSPGQAIVMNGPVETTVTFVDDRKLGDDYAARIRRLTESNPSLDMTNRNLFLVLERPGRGRTDPAMMMSQCKCECGGAWECGGGGGGGGSSRSRSQLVNPEGLQR